MPKISNKTIDYKLKDGKKQVFILAPKNASEADKILQAYLNYAKQKGQAVTQQEGIFRFRDPYNASIGMVNLKRKDSYLLGMGSDDFDSSKALFSQIEKKMDAPPLLKFKHTSP